MRMIQITEKIDVEIAAAQKGDRGASGDLPDDQKQAQDERGEQRLFFQRQRERLLHAFLCGLPERAALLKQIQRREAKQREQHESHEIKSDGRKLSRQRKGDLSQDEIGDLQRRHIRRDIADVCQRQQPHEIKKCQQRGRMPQTGQPRKSRGVQRSAGIRHAVDHAGGHHDQHHGLEDDDADGADQDERHHQYARDAQKIKEHAEIGQ